MFDMAIFARKREWKDVRCKRRYRSRSSDSRNLRGKKAPPRGRGGGGRGVRSHLVAERLLQKEGKVTCT